MMANTAKQTAVDSGWGFSVQMKRRNVCHVGSTDELPYPLSSEEEHKALLRRNEGDINARNTLVEHNLRLVVYMACKYMYSSISVEDLISIGTIGLLKAVNSFKIENGARLSTYASRCIENEILMALRWASRLQLEVSFDVPVYNHWDGNGILLSDILATDANLVSRDLDDIEYRNMLHVAVQRLSIRDRKIVGLRYGLYNGPPHTQNEVAQIMGISQSRISRIERRIYKQLKADLLTCLSIQ